jgi:hypothetical protein
VHRSAPLFVLSAVAIAAALGLSGCSHKVDLPPTTPVTLTPYTPPPTGADTPLPPPEALIDVMVRLTEPNVSGKDKVGLIENANPDDAAAIDRFDKAVTDGGFRPLTFEASDVGWSAKPGGNVLTTMLIKTANTQVGEGGNFSFPLEFVSTANGWQLTRDSANMLLQYGGPAPSSSAESPPPPPPAPPGP